MQAITTKYFGPTNARGSRIKATAERGSITVPYDHSLTNQANHVAAAQALVDLFIKQDLAQRSEPPQFNPWLARRSVGMLPGGSYAHVLTF
jgi:hypothetical protein